MSRVAVSGGAGFIGSHLVERLIRDGKTVVALDDLSNGRKENLASVWKNPRFSFLEVDVSNYWPRLSNVSLAYHLACFPRSKCLDDPARDLEVNVRSTIQLLRAYPEAKIVFASNSGIFSTDRLPITEASPDAPTLPYDLDKKTSEEWLKMYGRLYGTRSTIFRFPSVFGPRQRIAEGWKPVIPEFFDCLMTGRRAKIYGSATRDLCFVEDIVDALIRAEDKGDGETLLLGTDTETSIPDLYRMIEKAVGKEAEPELLPAKVGDIARMRYDYSKARRVLGWSPKVSLEEGLEEVKRWMSR